MKTVNVPCDFDQEWAAALRLRQAKAFGRTLVRYATVTLACVSILVMGSDGPYFPWANIAGAVVLALIAWRTTR